MSFSDELKQGIACNTVNRPDSVIARTACIVAHPGRMALFPFFRWFEKHYAKRFKFPRLAFTFDLFAGGLTFGLLLVGLLFWFSKPHDFGDNVLFSADVAPHEVVTGAPSTLVIHYANATGEELRHAKLRLGFPAHFLLQELSSDLAKADERDTFDLGTIAAGDEGNIKIRGVMFGDVGGKQTFRSILTFTHGKTDEAGQKIDYHSFSPVHSALILSLEAPNALYGHQQMEGTVTYRNDGQIDFPDLAIKPVWPAGFALSSSSLPLKNGAVDIAGIKAGDAGSWTFRGTLGEATDKVRFEFDPSFAFGDERYAQEALVLERPVAPPPLEVSHTIGTLRPGETAEVTVRYKNTADHAVTDVSVGIETDGPLFAKQRYLVDATMDARLKRVESGAEGVVTVRVPVRASIQQSDLSPDGSLRVATRAYASYALEGVEAPLVSRGTDVSAPPVTPFILASTARYATPSGDQLGRGPLPPVVGDTTTYWIFWNVRGTVNQVKDVRVEGTLPANVRFTGRQTVSQGEPVAYDAATRTVRWTPGTIAPTLPSGAQAAGAAFEVALTPTDSQAGKEAPLLTNADAVATDAATGAPLVASTKNATTDLPQDPLAAGFGLVSP